VRNYEARVEETLLLIQNEIFKSGYQKLLGAGVVLTGGACQLQGLPELAEFILEMPVRRAQPAHVKGLSDAVSAASFSTAVGLVKFGAENAATSQNKNTRGNKGAGNLWDAWGQKVKDFIDQSF
jgi:cell division protein FtsA